MKLPETASVAQRKDAIMRIAMIPVLPAMPAPPMTTAETMIMKIVMPETGSLPVKAIELMPTTESISAKSMTSTNAMTVCVRLSAHITWKKTANRMVMSRLPKTICVIGRSCCVRSSMPEEEAPFEKRSATARLTTRTTTPDIESSPMMPDIASMPMPMWRTYCEKTASTGALASSIVSPPTTIVWSPPR